MSKVFLALLLTTVFCQIAIANGQDDGNFMDNFDPSSENQQVLLDILEDAGIIEDDSTNPLLWQTASSGCQYPLQIIVSRAQQRLHLYEGCNPKLLATWKVSTGIAGRGTPSFRGTPTGRFESRGYSSSKYPGGGCKPYGNMSFAVFYTNSGYAIHGTCAEHRLGQRASHGCVRISRGNAKYLQELVRSVYGHRNTLIEIQ